MDIHESSFELIYRSKECFSKVYMNFPNFLTLFCTENDTLYYQKIENVNFPFRNTLWKRVSIVTPAKPQSPDTPHDPPQ